MDDIAVTVSHAPSLLGTPPDGRQAGHFKHLFFNGPLNGLHLMPLLLFYLRVSPSIPFRTAVIISAPYRYQYLPAVLYLQSSDPRRLSLSLSRTSTRTTVNTISRILESTSTLTHHDH